MSGAIPRTTNGADEYYRSHVNAEFYVKQAGRRHGSLACMSLCKYRSCAHLLKLTRTSVKLTGKLVCDVACLVSIVSEIFSPKFPTMIIYDDVISDVIRPGSTIREDHIDTPYRGTLC